MPSTRSTTTIRAWSRRQLPKACRPHGCGASGRTTGSHCTHVLTPSWLSWVRSGWMWPTPIYTPCTPASSPWPTYGCGACRPTMSDSTQPMSTSQSTRRRSTRPWRHWKPRSLISVSDMTTPSRPNVQKPMRCWTGKRSWVVLTPSQHLSWRSHLNCTRCRGRKPMGGRCSRTRLCRSSSHGC